MLRYPENPAPAAKIIRETSSTVKDTVKKFHESGAIPELAGAVQEAAVAAEEQHSKEHIHPQSSRVLS